MRPLFTVTLATLGLLLWSQAAHSTEPRRVGVLSLHRADQEAAGKIGANAFRAGMRALGYTEPHDLIVEERHADGEPRRLPALAAELVRARVEIIVAVGTEATQAARDSTSSLPIVMAGVG